MSSPSVTVLDFFILEATEYIDRLDVVVGAAGIAKPDAEALARAARALRGSAMMSRQTGIAELAGALERAVAALRDGVISWDPAARAAFTSSVDDLRQLLRHAREWRDDDTARVRHRAAELSALVPASARPTGTPRRQEGYAYLAQATSELAQLVEQVIQRHGDRSALDQAMRQTRALRGIAAISDIPWLAEVLEAVEDAGKSVEQGAGSTAASQRTLLSAAAAVLRERAGDASAGRALREDSPALSRFRDALLAAGEARADADHVVPISQLFYEGPGPHILSEAANRPTSPAERFRLEVVSQAEHIRRLIADARAAADPASADRHLRALRAAVRSLQATAESFGEGEVARFARDWRERSTRSHPAAFTSLERAVALLADPDAGRETLVRELDRLTSPQDDATETAPARAPAAAATEPLPAPANGARVHTRTPTGEHLRQFLEDGILTIGQLEEQPLAEPVPIPDDDIVPITSLLYSGRSALERAVQLRDEVRHQFGDGSSDALDELFDLLDLAYVDSQTA
ncbi:MAG TPA: Hpt domain-containing protein [Gemmatimonadaceae bacterium]|nr:Hpt domain-containing protein [Gemmatimonadaceae bacterium]